MELFLDDILFKCGIISATTILNLDNKNKYRAYINFSEDNLFHENKDIKELVEKPISESEAEMILAKHIISYFDKVKYEDLRNRIL